MATLPLRLFPRRHHLFHSNPTLIHLFSSLFTPTTHFSFSPLKLQQHLYISTSSPKALIRSHSLRLPNSSLPTGPQETLEDFDNPTTKSRNEKKREARRAVRWGMEMANFSPPQIKRIIRVASLEPEVFEALMLVKRLGPDVREGKRRQFSYIGRLLRNVQPELMDALIQASKDGDNTRLQSLCGQETWAIEEDEEEVEETESDEDEEVSHNSIDLATRWFDGLIDKDSSITNEVYSVHNVEFDRQELRKLVRRVDTMQERQETGEEVDAALSGAKKSLTSFLRTLAKKVLTTEWM
ncbi:kinesin-like protein [Tasmannia lanceolata]|uniref:kinesin-like protein n=1 Tax=Tasmannia lanceolata TaxID=3420 RepID=UPI0040628C01